MIPNTELDIRSDELAGHENHEIIVYCRSGTRSVAASVILDSYNFAMVYNMLGGILAWQNAGYPIWVSENEEAPSLVQWWFWIIIATEILVLAGAAYLLKKRKPPKPDAPFQNPELLHVAFIVPAVRILQKLGICETSR